MKKKINVAVITFFLTELLSGCSAIDPDFTAMTEAYERAIDMHQNKSILANMLRASNNLPLIFTDITTVAGTGGVSTVSTANANFSASDPSSIPGFFSPGSGSTFGVASGLSTNRSFTFSLGSLNNEEFYRGFLTETPLEDLYFYIRTDNASIDLVMSLLVDSIQIVDKKGLQKNFKNDPSDADYESFKKLLYELIDDGLSAQMQQEDTPIGPQFPPEYFNKIPPDISKWGEGKLTIKKVSSKPELYQLVRRAMKFTFCFNPVDKVRRFGSEMLCDQGRSVATINVTGIKDSNDSKEVLSIKLRSTKGVFNYLGKVIALQNAPVPSVVTIRKKINQAEYVDEPLLRVVKGASSESPLVASVSYQGSTYSVPLKNSGYSTFVFQIMSVMVTMNKIPGSIPASPGVLIR